MDCTVALCTDMRTVNPILAHPTPIHLALHEGILFLPLLEEDPGDGSAPPTFKPALASSCKFSDDRLALTFKLRKDVVWSDGEPVTARDVAWTWQVHTMSELGWTGADSKQNIHQVEAVDAHTVRFHFTRPSLTQLLDANQGAVLPSHAWSRLAFPKWRERPEWFLDNLVVNGPFTLESWTPGERFVLARNERYHVPHRPLLDRIVFEVAESRGAKLDRIRSGDAHLVTCAHTPDATDLGHDPEIEIRTVPAHGVQGISWNTKDPLFASAAVRRALSLAIDRQEIVHAVHPGHARPTTSPFHVQSWAYTDEPPIADPEQARTLLAGEGWRDKGVVLEKDGQPFRFEILSEAGNPVCRAVLTQVLDQLRRIGVVGRALEDDPNRQLERALAHDYQAASVGIALGTGLDACPFFHSSATAGGGLNMGSYANAEVDLALEEIRRQTEPETARPLFARFQELLRRDQPVTFLFQVERMVAHRRTLRGVKPHRVHPYAGIQDWVLES